MGSRWCAAHSAYCTLLVIEQLWLSFSRMKGCKAVYWLSCIQNTSIYGYLLRYKSQKADQTCQTSRRDSNQKSRCFLYPSSRKLRRPTRPTTAKTASHQAQTLRRDEGGRRRSNVTSLNQRMDELCFLLARPKVEYQESRTLTNQRCDKGLAKIKSCPALDCVNPPLREKEKESSCMV